jgi:hypothetical protein
MNFRKESYLAIFAALLLLTPVHAATITVKPGMITPDSPLWNLDVWMDDLSLMISSNKPIKRLEIAEERMAEVQAMAEQGDKCNCMRKAQMEYQKQVIEASNDIGRMSDLQNKLEAEVEVQSRLDAHQKQLEKFAEIIDTAQIDEHAKDNIQNVISTMEINRQSIHKTVGAMQENTERGVKEQTGMTEEDVNSMVEEHKEKMGVVSLDVQSDGNGGSSRGSGSSSSGGMN